MMNYRYWIGLVLLVSSVPLSAQHDFRLGWLPEINLNTALTDRWSLNAKVESRPLLSTGTFGAERSAFSYSLTDLSLAGATKVGLNQTLSLGYLLRLTRTDVRHRLFQQYSFVQALPALRLGHRFASDQTFAPGRTPEIRLRYRLSLELPLSGQQVDPREFYLKVSQEQLHSFSDDPYDLELRLVPVLGFVFSDRNKMETGIDYRLDGFLNAATRSSFWWKLAWYRKW